MYETGTVKQVDNSQENNPVTFSRACWEKPTSKYLASVQKLDDEQWRKINKAAKALNRATRLLNSLANPIVIDDNDSVDPRSEIGDDV